MDGNPDIATAVRANQAVFVLLGSGDGSFPTPATVFSAPDPLRQQPPALLAVLDVDQDGRDDLIVATDAQSDGSLTLALSRGAGFVTTPIAPVLPTPQILLTEDLDCDGLKDIILYNSGGNQISVYLNSGVGGFISTPQMITVTNAVLSMAVANLDATDLRPDIVVLSQTGPTLATYQNVSN
jgi:hypothetical protein